MNGLESIAKVGVYGALLTLLGAHAAQWIGDAALPAHDSQVWRRRAARIASSSALALLAFVVLRLFTHTVSLFEWPGLFSIENLTTVGWRSRWGGPWRLQVIAAGAAALAARWMSRTDARWARLLSAAAALAATSTLPLMGHAAGDMGRASLHVAHLVGAGLWLGTLAALVAGGAGAKIFSAFSSVAMIGAALAVGAGLALTLLYLGSVENLVATTYGRLLMAKLAALAATLACGFVNWRRVRAGESPRLASLETALALLIVVVTAWLTETEHP